LIEPGSAGFGYHAKSTLAETGEQIAGHGQQSGDAADDDIQADQWRQQGR